MAWRLIRWLALCAGLACMAAFPANAAPEQGKKPDILVIWGDGVGMWNISANSRGTMGYKTPNIDRIAKEGLSVTDYYGQQSCVAGRAAFIGGNVPVRTGMTKVGLPGAKERWQKTDVTVATVMKCLGCATGQFGKNHQGDHDEHLPTMHGAPTYNDWFLERSFVAVPMQRIAAKSLMTMKDYPPSQTRGSFNLEKVQKQIEAAGSGR